MGVEKVEEPQEPETSYEEACKFVNAIAQPLASKKLAKKIYKLIKKASKQKLAFAGLKEVQKRLRKDEKGVVILAGDITPVDIISHIPGVCEFKGIPYCYTPSRKDLGTAMGVFRWTAMILVKPHSDYQELYDEIYETFKNLNLQLI